MRTILKTFILASLTTACVSGRGDVTGEDTVKTAPSPSTSRLFDCMGKNQTTLGNTRTDCLPNQGDAAERDTEAGAGSTEVRP